MMEYSTTSGTSGICPEGWHIPTNQEFNDLTDIFGGYEMAGQHMKSCTDDWLQRAIYINTNESGFTGLPGGERKYNSAFAGIGNGIVYWTSDEHPNYTNTALSEALRYDNDELLRYRNIFERPPHQQFAVNISYPLQAIALVETFISPSISW